MLDVSLLNHITKSKNETFNRCDHSMGVGVLGFLIAWETSLSARFVPGFSSGVQSLAELQLQGIADSVSGQQPPDIAAIESM